MILPGGASGSVSFPTVRAEAFERKEFGGRNRAVSLVCRTEDGTVLVCVTKLRGRVAPEAAFWIEWAAGLIADELGVFVPPRYVVEVSEGFARVLAKSLGGTAADYVGPSFGIEYVPNTTPVLDQGVALDAHLREPAAAVMVFDAFIDNVDRRRDNPNCLIEAHAGLGSRIVAIDHDCAFAGLYLPLIGQGGPVLGWPDDLMQKHVFLQRFGNSNPSIEAIRAKIAALSDAFLDGLTSKVPPLWLLGSADASLRRVIIRLKERRDTIDTWFPKVEKWVQA